TAQVIQEGPQVVGRADRQAATPIRSLDLDDRLPEQLLDETSGVKGDFHAPFCGSPGVRFPRATRRLLTLPRHPRRSAASRPPVIDGTIDMSGAPAPRSRGLVATAPGDDRAPSRIRGGDQAAGAVPD